MTRIALKLINVSDICRILRCERLQEVSLKVYENALLPAEISALVLLANVPHEHLRCVRLSFSPAVLRDHPLLLQISTRQGLTLIVTYL